jgi:hypothetical protein
MPADIKAYLDEVRTHLHLDSQTEKRILSEISAHFQDKVNELEEEGFTRAAAEREAVSAFGEARSIARLMYEACSRGSWVDAFMSFQPHAIAAALFATHYWNNPYVLSAALAGIAVITVMGWRSGAPTWMYSWAGYAFFPLLIMAFIFRHPMAQTLGFLFTGMGVPVSIWALAGLIAYYAGVCWLLLWALVQVSKRDWLFVSLMLLPLPALGFWVLTMEQNGIQAFAAAREIGPVFSSWDSMMAFFCFALGVTSTLFIRMRRRFFKAVAILGIGIVAGALVLRSIRGDTDPLRMLVTSACLLAVLGSPLLLHAFIGHEISEKDARS